MTKCVKFRFIFNLKKDFAFNSKNWMDCKFTCHKKCYLRANQCLEDMDTTDGMQSNAIIVAKGKVFKRYFGELAI